MAATGQIHLSAQLRTYVRFLLLLVLLVASGSLTACKRAKRFVYRHTHRGQPVMTAAKRAQITRGHEAYVRYCALCHRADAQGYAADHANAIGNPQFLAIATDDFLRAAIADGRPGTPMSAWGRLHGGPLEDSVIDDLVVYLRSLARGPTLNVHARRVEGNALRAQAVWTERCQQCHGDRGEGTVRATSLSHPNFQRTASNGFIRVTIQDGRAGTPMGGFKALGPQMIDDLVAYVRTLEHMPRPPVAPVAEPPPSLDQLIMNPTGRAPRFTLRDDRYVPAEEVRRALEEHRRMVILDARATSDWGLAHIPGALPFPFYDIEQMASRLPHDGTWILAYCACPHAASGHVVDELRSRHFEHTAVIDEGIGFWTAHGFPTARAAGAGTGPSPTGK